MSRPTSTQAQPSGLRNRLSALGVGLSLVLLWLLTQGLGVHGTVAQGAVPAGAATDPTLSGFTFARLRYRSSGGWNEAYYQFEGRIWQRWETDYPQADRNFARRLATLTSAQPYSLPLVTDLSDPKLFSYPFLYVSDSGWMELSDKETERLRQYLLRGGFLWADDFWGDAEWRNFERVMQSVLPEARWEPIPDDHPIFKTLYPLPTLPQIPAKSFADMGMTYDDPTLHRFPWGSMTPAHFRGYHDSSGRLVAVATHNTDIGDGWEREAYGERFFRLYSRNAYALGVDIVLHALTH